MNSLKPSSSASPSQPLSPSLSRPAIQVIAFIGYRGSGKSTLAQALAKETKWPVYSSDKWVEQAAGCSISSLVATKGWKTFRKHEHTAIQSLLKSESLSKSQMILDCGGGVVENPSLMKELSQKTFIIYVKTSFHAILTRLKKLPRPKLTAELTLKQETKLKLSQRSPLYKTYSHVTLNNYRSLNLVLTTLLKHLKHNHILSS